jgi:hypothetical protein
MSWTDTDARPPAFAAASSAIAGARSQAVTSYPRSSIATKLSPVPHATSSRRLPRRPADRAASSTMAHQSALRLPSTKTS